MHLDSLCAYLVFFVSLLLFWFSCVAFSCFFFRVIYSKFFLLNFQIISRVTLFPLFILLQLLNMCLLASVHLTISVCCSSSLCSPTLFINSITNFRFRSAANFPRIDNLCFSYSVQLSSRFKFILPSHCARYHHHHHFPLNQNLQEEQK